jgi:BirA family biotin operon repressor/biotin-[acetyl-CoA-carboxylase] ligase
MALSAASSPATSWLARLERFDLVGSTNDVVAGWLRHGTPEVCVAIAGEQSSGRGRNGRTWTAPAGASLLMSVGFTPTWLPPEHAWRLGAIVSLAMAEAAEEVARIAAGTVRLKWPNDLVMVDAGGGAVRKVGGVLGETSGLGTNGAQAVIGIGINVDWTREAFPADIAADMTSLLEAAGGRSVGRDALAEACLRRLRPLVEGLMAGDFDGDAWRERHLTNGLPVRLEWPDGLAETVIAEDVDVDTGALVIGATDGESPRRRVLVGEIRHLRFGGVV